MKESRFIEGLPPKGFKPDFESFLFNEERHRYLQSPSDWRSYHLVRDKKILCSVHFHLHAGSAVSPAKAPFGSVEVSKKISSKELYGFLVQVEAALRALGINRIELKDVPACYRPSQAALLEVLLVNLGYRVSSAKITTAIPVDGKSYDSKIEPWELRKLKQGKKARLKFHELNLKSLLELYEFILSCRLERRQSLSMTAEEILKVAEAFPDRIVLFGVYDDVELAAVSVSIRVTARMLYNFYSGHPRKFDALSPVVTLMNGIYAWSRKNQVELIDLGTSAEEHHPNFSLLDFKIRLGGIPCTKLVFEKVLQ